MGWIQVFITMISSLSFHNLCTVAFSVNHHLLNVKLHSSEMRDVLIVCRIPVTLGSLILRCSDFIIDVSFRNGPLTKI